MTGLRAPSHLGLDLYLGPHENGLAPQQGGMSRIRVERKVSESVNLSRRPTAREEFAEIAGPRISTGSDILDLALRGWGGRNLNLALRDLNDTPATNDLVAQENQ